MSSGNRIPKIVEKWELAVTGNQAESEVLKAV